MSDYAAATTTVTDATSPRSPKKLRNETFQIPSDVSIQSVLEESKASSNDQFYPDFHPNDEMDVTVPPEDDDQCANANDDEPKWAELCEYEFAKDQIQDFLGSREKRSNADHRFASGMDQLHDSVSKSIEDLVGSMVELFQTKSDFLDDYERNLNCDYIQNERKRRNMQTTLKESARVAQGLFASLLMRIAQPAGLLEERSKEKLVEDEDLAAKNVEGGDEFSDQDMEGIEPDWCAISQHEPAKTEVPIYLEARNRREVAGARFEAAVQDFQQSTEECLQDLTQSMVDMYNERSSKLDEYEYMLKHEYVHNDEVRSKLQANIEESANAASEMFEKLLSRVLNQEQVPSQEVGAMT